VNGPYKVPALLGLGLVSENAADYGKALEWYRKVVKEDPQNVAALTAIARLDVASTGGSVPASTPAAP
jgi:cytochrome c-type biogenesis protein CcmH/NrfG